LHEASKDAKKLVDKHAKELQNEYDRLQKDADKVL
jgi:hypothetical protein